ARDRSLYAIVSAVTRYRALLHEQLQLLRAGKDSETVRAAIGRRGVILRELATLSESLWSNRSWATCRARRVVPGAASRSPARRRPAPSTLHAFAADCLAGDARIAWHAPRKLSPLSTPRDSRRREFHGQVFSH